MSTNPWLRIIKVTLGPLEEWRGNTGGNAVTWQSDGTLNGLRVACRVQKTIMGTPSPSTIEIYNLGRELRNGIRSSLTKIRVDAGWSNTDLRLVFQGSVLNSFSERQGADIITKIVAIPGYGALVRGVSSATFSQGSDIRSSILQLSEDLPGVEVNSGNFHGVEGKINPGGWSFAGSTKDGLTKLSDEYGFSWSINDGELNVIGDKAMLPDFVDINGENGGLISIVPLVSGPMQIETGVRITALYIPGITVGSSVKVASSINPKLNGIYRINTMNISIDAYNETWTMTLESFRY